MKVIGINLIPLYIEQGSGAFRYIKLLLQEIGNYKLKDCKFIVYKQRCITEEYLDIPSKLHVEYVNVPNVGRGLKRILFEQTLFYLYIKKCDVFYSYCSSIPFFLRSKKVFTLHDVYFLTEKSRYGFVQRNYLKIITYFYLKLCDKVLTVSEFSRNEISRHYNIEASEIAITYNFINKSNIIIDNTPPSIADSTGNFIGLTIAFFLFIGNIHPGKNIIRMVDGFKLFNQREGYKYNLLISGKMANDGKSILKAISGIPNIYYLDYQPRENVEWLLKNCISVVLLSLCEGFGIPPLEGFLYGKPALVSNYTSLPEVVGNAGVCVDPLSIDEIATGFSVIEEKYNDLSLCCKEQLKKFSPQRSAEIFLKELGISFA